MQTRRLKNAASGKSANDTRNYSREEKEERLRIVRGTPLTIDLGTGTQEDVALRQSETDLDRLLLEDTDRAGPVPVNSIETTITAGHSRLFFVIDRNFRAQSLNTAYFSYLFYQYIWLIEITGCRFTGKNEGKRTMAFKYLCAQSAECCIKSSGVGLGRTPRMYGFQEYQSKKRGRA